MQLDVNLIKKSIESSSQVIIMAHRNLDLDALGSSLGIEYLCKSLDKKTYLLIEDKEHEVGVARGLNELRRQKINVNINTYDELKDIIDEKTLLIIVDTHIASIVQSASALSIPNVLIIDHHVAGDEEKIANVYQFIGEEHASTIGIVIDLLRQLNIYIHPYIATIMLAGIFIDTNGFFNKIDAKTHEEAAYLYKCGALQSEVQYLLKEDMALYNDRQEVVRKARVIKGGFIVALGNDDNIYRKEDLAKISDTMLLFNNIEASFTIGYISEGVIGISARSLGSVDVQVIMEKFGGGGHVTDAAAQIKNQSLKTVEDKLEEILKLKGGF